MVCNLILGESLQLFTLVNRSRIPNLLERLRPSGGSGDRGKDNSSPFVHSSHGNPAFTPQKIGKGGPVVSVSVACGSLKRHRN